MGWGEILLATQEMSEGRYPYVWGETAAASELWAEEKICSQLYKLLLHSVPKGVYAYVYIYVHNCVYIYTHEVQ